MRFSIAYYLVLLYVTVMLKPILPVISDAWSHTFAEVIHVSTIHAKYGANHLEKELAAEGQDNNKTDNTAKTAEPVPVHIPEQVYTCEIFQPTEVKYYPSLRYAIPPPVVITTPVPPPDQML